MIAMIKTLATGAFMFITSSVASAETLCVVGDAYIEMGEIVPPSVVVSRNIKAGTECPNGSVAFIQETEKRELSSTEIKRLRARHAAAQTKQCGDVPTLGCEN